MIFYNEARNLALLTIPKNCSESIMLGLKRQFVHYDAKKLPKNTDAIVIFRDPVNRWISGSVEYFAYPEGLLPHPMSVKGIEINLTQWLEKPRPWDFHTELQSTSYNWQDFNLKPYWYNKDVLKQINKDYNCFDRILQTHQEPFRKKYKKMILDFIDKDKYRVMSHLSALYQNDYDFFQTLKFVNG